MMNLKKTKICDPLYDYIYLDQGEKSLIDHNLFQRLRFIQQLGFVEQAFPSGTGNRFGHSLGACHLAGKAFDSIFNKNKNLPISESKKQKLRKTLKTAALMHDIGHGPLSHSSESLMPQVKELSLENFLNTDFKRQAYHEDYSIKFIMEKEGFYTAIKQIELEPSAVAQLLHPEFFGGEDFFKEGGLNFLPLLRQIISSDFDVDRMDYLHRDSLYCGVKYGLIDFVWLISHFDCHIENKHVFLAIGKEGLYTLESFILGRQHMRSIVYFHHKPVIYNKMLKKYARDCRWRLPSDIQNYARFIDSKLFDRLKSDDNVWAKRIIERRAYLRLYEYIFFESSYESDKTEEGREKISFLKKNLEKEGIDFIEINSERDSIKPYNKQTLKTYKIYLKNSALKQVSELYKDPAFLTFPKRKIQRIYVAPEGFSKAKAFLLKKDIH